jgi:ribonuclease-3
LHALPAEVRALSERSPQKKVQRKLGYAFDSPELLEAALTHRSAGARNNERLEFLGDGILNTVVAIEVFHRRPEAPEGELSRLRAALVRGETLAGIGAELGVGEALSLGEGERKSGGRRRTSIVADAVEAVIGAVYLDSDFDTVYRLIRDLFGARLADLPSAEALKDPKTRLQEFLQHRHVAPPTYEIVETTGADHARQYTVRCQVPGYAVETTATATSRRKAEQAAAHACLQRLEASGSP